MSCVGKIAPSGARACRTVDFLPFPLGRVPSSTLRKTPARPPKFYGGWKDGRGISTEFQNKPRLMRTQMRSGMRGAGVEVSGKAGVHPDTATVCRMVGLRCRAASPDDQQVVPTKNNRASAMVAVLRCARRAVIALDFGAKQVRISENSHLSRILAFWPFFRWNPLPCNSLRLKQTGGFLGFPEKFSGGGIWVEGAMERLNAARPPKSYGGWKG